MTIIVATEDRIVADGAEWQGDVCVDFKRKKVYQTTFKDWTVYIAGAGDVAEITHRRRLLMTALSDANVNPMDFTLGTDPAHWRMSGESASMLVVFTRGGEQTYAYQIFEVPVPIPCALPTMIGHPDLVSAVYGGLDAGAPVRDAIHNALNRTGLSGATIHIDEIMFKQK